MTDLLTDPAAAAREAAHGRPRPALGIIDCDVHNAVPNDAALRPYLPARWRDHMDHVGSRTFSPYENGFVYPKVGPGGGSRADAWPPSGALPGSDLPFMREQLLDRFGIDRAILNCLYRAAEQRHEEYGAALARAVNEWQVEHWLEQDARLRASITVTFESPEPAAAEIRRAAGHPGFVQVLLFPRTLAPLGRRRYWPIYEAAQECGLPVGIHFASTTGAPITSAGWPSFYIEDHTSMSVAFQAQVTSLILEGVFDRFPQLTVVLIEGGFAWVPPLMWRLDHLYHRLGAEVPDLQRLPSEYLRDRVRITTQPIEEPERPADLLDLIDEIGRDILMFSTDYPHWDFDHPQRAFQTKLPPDVHTRIMRGNALDCYALGT
ncbi:amidohydrolase family protein [Pseudonocardia acidicola]|uniref:Amidohydrolase n=1 Tax=Pseudonocardia acidicola TaxID=2724939 RepID=A0ABX1SF90_9PSEU|nr:amidohydrolase family protein [Pseudonocardia acidicola]NMH99780.1 amidohydrolase [Pseudonocardia acidicola]